MQIALVGTVGMKVTLCQRGRKDYALLNAERMVHISLLFMLLKFFFVINSYKMFFCIFFLLLSNFFWVFPFGVGSSNVEGLGF